MFATSQETCRSTNDICVSYGASGDFERRALLEGYAVEEIRQCPKMCALPCRPARERQAHD